jgi:hypothetical protein
MTASIMDRRMGRRGWLNRVDLVFKKIRSKNTNNSRKRADSATVSMVDGDGG